MAIAFESVGVRVFSQPLHRFHLNRSAKPLMIERTLKEGFTLIELLVALSVISILIAIAVASYGAYREKGKKAQALSVLRELQWAAEMLATDTERWPGPNPCAVISNDEVWDLNAGNAGLVITNGAFPGWQGPYMPTVPKDPWGQDYYFDPDYEIGGRDFAVVGSFGPNGVGKNLYDADDIVLILPTQ